MSDRTASSRFYPKLIGDPGRDRNTRTLHFTCVLLAFAVAVVAVSNIFQPEPRETPLLFFAVAGFLVAAAMNRAGKSAWAARIALLALLLTATLMVFEARDGFRSHAMLVFPALLLISVMLLDRVSYVTTAVVVLVAVAALGIAERYHLTRAIPHVRTSTHYGSIFTVELSLAVFALIGNRIARDTQHNVSELRTNLDRLRIAKDAARLGIYEYDVTTGAIFWDARVRQLWGVGPDVPITIDTFFSGLHPEDRAKTQTLLERSLDPAGSGQYYAEYRVISQADGSERWVAATGQVFFKNGRPSHMIGTGQDISERKRVEAVVIESEERFRGMADTAPVMIWVSGLDKRGTFFNKAWLDFTGRTMVDECGDGWISGVHPDDLDHCLGTCGASFNARRPFQIEFRLRRADGEYRWILDTGVPRYRHGEFIGFIGSCVDLTERRLIEERLRTREAQLTDAQRLAKVGSWELEPESGRLQWSGEMFRIFGVPEDAQPDLEGFLGLVHSKDRERIRHSRNPAAASTTPITLEFRIVRPDGNTRFVRSIVQTMKNDVGEPLRFVGATQDITEQIWASQHLRESEERLRYAERIAHLGNWSWDLKTDELSWSEEVFRIHGQPTDFKPSYETFLGGIAPEDADRVGQWLRGCIAQKKGGSIEHRIVRPNRDLRTVSCTAEVLLDEENMPTRMFGTCQDVTDVRRGQEESFARQKLESVGTLAGGIAHDFNNLLGAILGQAELALTELETGSSPRGELEAIREVALRGSEIVRQLMIYAGKESETIGPIDLSRTVAEMVELLKVSVSKHALVVTDLDRTLPLIHASGAQIRRIVMNLVMNASQAIRDQDGVIRMSTGRVAAAQAAALANSGADREYVELEVSDNGCGMSQEMQSKVFDPFFTTRSAGHGLGLAVVQGIVRNLGGTIHLESEPSRGTTFRILLPCVPAAAEETAVPQTNAGKPARESLEATVLIVEDEGVLRQAVAKALRGIGAEALEAADGSAAIDLLRAEGSKIDVILLDLTIPGASSQEVLAEAAHGRPDLKVILTSAYSEEMAAASMGLPFIQSFIRKPFRLADLMKTVRLVLSS